ncbi:MAG: adenylate/guanylate cyclase domain-containing protein, partial [Candidatus Limnocylindrales bacterium]
MAELRLVSVVFVDLVGFTTASENRDAEDTRELLSHYYDTAREIMGRHGGTIEKFIGDAVMAVWGAPTAHEDDAERAVRSAMELVHAVPRLSGADQQLQARAGVLTGEAAVTIGAEGQGMVAGDLVNTAARLQAAAAPGTVLVGEATYRAASRAIEFEDAGQRELKGKEAAVHVWQAVSVVALRGGEGRAVILEPPFVGRDDELQLLKELFHATAREGKPRLVTVSGLAGIGKSRLLWELEKYLDGVVEDVFWQEGRSPSYGEGISYWALAEMLRGRAGISDADDPDGAREKVAAMLVRFVPDETERRWIEPRVLGLLSLDELPSETRDELFAAWRTLFERMAAQAPVVLVFLDLQWADQGMLDFVEHVLTWARTSPIVVLAETRVELFDRRPTWGRNIRSASLVHLEPLPERDMRRLLDGLVPDLPGGAARRIVERAEGVPLYAVELLRMLIDRGVLLADGRQYRATGDIPELSVPETLHALIAARLDALPQDQRGLIADCAVLGVSFSLSALVSVSQRTAPEVGELVDGLARRELLILDADPRSSERGQHRFLQGVVREVAYQSLAKRDRLAKHVAAARYFEALGDDEIAGVLATHYLAAHRAARPGPESDALAAQARVALRAAAERATALHDLVGAITYVEQALTITADVAEQAALHERAVPLAGEAAQFQRAYDHAREARSLFVQLDDRLAVVRTAAAEAVVQLSEHRDQTTIAMLEGDLAAVADLPPSPEVASAQAELARAMMLAGHDDAVAWCDRVLAQPSVATPQVLLEAIITKGTALQLLGRVVESEALLRGATVIADTQGNLFASARSRNNLGVMLQHINLRDALELEREVYDLARRYG